MTSDKHIFYLTNKEKRFLRDEFASLAVDLAETADVAPNGIHDETCDELCRLQIVAQEFMELLGSNDMGNDLRRWNDQVRCRLNEIKYEP